MNQNILDTSSSSELYQLDKENRELSSSLIRKKSKQGPTIKLTNVSVIGSSYMKSQSFLNKLPELDIVKKDEFGVNIYCFTLQYEDCKDQNAQRKFGQKWEIRKRVNDFQELERSLSGLQYHIKHKTVHKEEAGGQDTMENLEYFLRSLFKEVNHTENHRNDIMKFIELSNINYGQQLKYKELVMKKIAGGRYGESKCKRCGTLWRSKDKRLFIITSEALMYCKGPGQDECTIREVLQFDSQFQIFSGMRETGNKRGIIIKTASRKLELIAMDFFSWVDFVDRLTEALVKSPYRQTQRFNSFAPCRSGICKWYISGQDYFSDMFDQLKLAKYTVYITDWWLSPEFYLKRPVGSQESFGLNRNSRLDLALKDVADRGVEVYIIVYQEPTIALNNDSLHTQTYLERLSENIKVLRHPQQNLVPFMWSHHEKLVVIDQQWGFMGGLDLCFGRMDNSDHRLFDMPYESSHLEQEVKEFWPGIDYSNSRVKDFFNVKKHEFTLLENKRSSPKMPWQDIAIFITGEAVTDMVRHFIQYWNHVTIDSSFDKRVNGGQLIIPDNLQKNEEGFTGIVKKLLRSEKEPQYVTPQMNEQQNGLNNYIDQLENDLNTQSQEESKQQNNVQNIELSRGRSISNSSDKNDYYSQAPKTNRRVTLGRTTINPIVDREYVQMIKDLAKPHPKEQCYFIPVNAKTNLSSTLTLPEHHFQNNRRPKITHQYIPKENTSLSHHSKTSQQNTMQCQMLRSASNWSIGISESQTELSIQLAYLELIRNARKFIYIENQFFISSSAGKAVNNKVVEALVQRIKEAVKNKERFKVVIFVPLLPGFEGEINNSSSAILKVQLHWEYATISRGGTSLLEQIRAIPNINVEDYIEFFSLRQHDIDSLTQTPCTEIIYIHSKLLIVDDCIVLIGSANINDRSLNGDRDSEIAIVVEDKSTVISAMDGAQEECAKFAHDLRVSLYASHFGLTKEECQDPLCPILEDKIRTRTAINTRIYREVFACYPDDNILSLADYDRFRANKNLDLYSTLSQEILGQAVQFPLEFLRREDLKIGTFQKEYICPENNFT